VEPDALSGMPSLLLAALDCGWRRLRAESEAWLFRGFCSRRREGLSELYATLGGGAIDWERGEAWRSQREAVIMWERRSIIVKAL